MHDSSHRLEACDAQACRLLFLAEGSTIPGSMLVQQSKLGHPTNDCPHLHRLAAPVSPGRPFFVTFGYSSNAFAFEMDAPDGHAVCLVLTTLIVVGNRTIQALGKSE